MIKMGIKRPNNNGFTAYFETKTDLEKFNLFIKTLIENVKKEGSTK